MKRQNRKDCMIYNYHHTKLKMQKRNKIKITYLIILLLFTIFVLLDTFVIPKSKSTAGNNIENQDENLNLGEYTDNSYIYDDIAINIDTMVKYESTIYVADIRLNDSKYLKTAFANNEYGRNIKEVTSVIAKQNNAILAINGDYYGFRDYGYVMRNGEIYRDVKNSDANQQDLILYADGRFEIEYEKDIDLEQLKADGATQVFSFGPSLVLNGEITVTQNQEVGIASPSNPRTAVGIIDEGHYVFVVSDGRTEESKGLSLYQLAEVMKEINCTKAYNLDGGGSTTMCFNGNVLNVTTGGHWNAIEERKISDIVYIGR